MMKRLILLSLISFSLLIPGVGLSQNPADFWVGLDTANAQDYRTVVGNIFGGLNPNLYPSGLLFNRTPGNSRILELQGRPNSPEINADEWLIAYDAISWSHVSPNQDLPHMTELYSQAMEDYAKSFSDDEFYTIPIGILDFTLHRLQDSALADELIEADQNGYLSHVQGAASPFLELQCFAAAGLADTIDSDTVHWELNPDYIRSNQSLQISMMEVDFGDGNGWIQVNQGGTYTVGYASPGDIHMQLKITYVNGGSRLAKFKVHNEASGRQRAGNNPDDDWVKEVTGDVSGKKYKAKVGVWYSCVNSSGKIRKPAIFVTGFNPIPKKFKKFYDQFNASGLFTRLREEGWDVIIVKWSKGVGYIEDNAEALVKVIDRINDEKQNHHAVFYENVITGYSQGGLIVRYCLADMEKQFMNGSRSSAHHCRTYLSYEGEQQGANVIYGAQLAVQGLLTTTTPYVYVVGAAVLIAAHGIYGSKAARELAYYHRSQASSTPGQGQDPLRTNFMNSMLNDFNHAGTHVKKEGYPSFTRLVGIASGSSVGTKFPLNEGQKFYQKTFGVVPGPGIMLFPGIRYRVAYYALDRNPNSVVYQKYYGFGWLYGIIPIVSIERKTNGALPFDNAPGGVEGKGQHNRISGFVQFALGWPLFGTNISNEECFTPTISTFDIRNHNGGPDLDYNVNDFDLFWTAPSTPNTNYGYPNLAHPTDRLDYTPFDALAGTTTNDEHVKPEPGVLKNFMMEEITPWWLKLQNRKVGEYHSYYRADFEARGIISLGRNVTHSTDKEDIVVLPSGDLRCMAGEIVDMFPGFEAEYGSYFDAYIGNMDVCNLRLAGPGTGEEDPDPIVQDEPATFEKTEVDNSPREFILYPNPSQGVFHLEVPDAGPWKTMVYDLGGRTVWSREGQINGTLNIKLEGQPAGVYFLVVQGKEEEWRKRIMLQ